MPTIRNLTKENTEEVAAYAAAILQNGGVILYPTDTLYALGASLERPHALEKIYSIKERDPKKSVSFIVADIDIAREYIELTPLAETLAKKFLPGPLTLIVNQKECPRDLRVSHDGSIGIRIPNDPFCLSVARHLGKPFTTTSANIAGKDTEKTIPKILLQLGAHIQDILLIIDAGELPNSIPSTVVDVRTATPIILRIGAISEEKILDAIK